jgi:hypothetical protein
MKAVRVAIVVRDDGMVKHCFAPARWPATMEWTGDSV